METKSHTFFYAQNLLRMSSTGHRRNLPVCYKYSQNKEVIKLQFSKMKAFNPYIVKDLDRHKHPALKINSEYKCGQEEFLILCDKQTSRTTAINPASYQCLQLLAVQPGIW